MIGDVSTIAILTATLLSVAFGNVWYTLLSTQPHESLRVTVIRVATYLIFFTVLAQLVPLMRGGHISFLGVAVLIIVFSVHQYPYLLQDGESIKRRTLIHIGHATFVALGGLSIITFWPW